MDKHEARQILQQRIQALRQRSYSDLEKLIGNQDVIEIVGESGSVYYLEREALWDDERRGHLRVVASIDDGGIRAVMPLTDSFIVGSDGHFIGE